MDALPISSIQRHCDRDLGGYPAAGGRVTAWERLLRGDNPTGLTEKDIEWLVDRDITTVIDLRSEEETKRKPDQLAGETDFRYFHAPMLGGERMPNLERDVGRGYFQVLDRKESACRILRLIAEAPGGVPFHCTEIAGHRAIRLVQQRQAFGHILAF